ncbi:TatD family hydrolase [Candidatus Woesearchaeota archaeon]|nr:TatD family hydrolase [Candidatus Woesearchaeota archaeon]
MILVDIHAHLDFPDFENKLDEIIERAKKADVKIIIANGISQKSNRKTLEIAKKYDIVKAALGIYPPEALPKETDEEINIDKELEFYEQNINNIIAIGEIGLDYKNVENKEFQKQIFTKQLEFAKKHNLPAIIHSRKAEEDVIDILENLNYKKVILHCFCGKKHLIEKAKNLGFYFSIPTNVVRAENIQNIAKTVNINQLLTETDAPFLSPFKDKTNEPSFVIESLKKIAEIKGFRVEETANSIWLNYQRLFA